MVLYLLKVTQLNLEPCMLLRALVPFQEVHATVLTNQFSCSRAVSSIEELSITRDGRFWFNNIIVSLTSHMVTLSILYNYVLSTTVEINLRE